MCVCLKNYFKRCVGVSRGVFGGCICTHECADFHGGQKLDSLQVVVSPLRTKHSLLTTGMFLQPQIWAFVF